MARISPLMLLPPAIFAGFVLLAGFGMFRENPDDLPSTFIGKPAPSLPAENLPGYPGFSAADLTSGEVTVVNFWASWCPPCRAEHPNLMKLAESGVRVFGVNFKDKAPQAITFLEDDGNPFLGVGFDPKGRTAIEWGVAGPPETFIVDGTGKILFKFIGPLVGGSLEKRFMPELEKALGQQTGGS